MLVYAGMHMRYVWSRPLTPSIVLKTLYGPSVSVLQAAAHNVIIELYMLNETC